MKHFNLDSAKEIINDTVSIFWFRRDLRIADNAGLYQALKNQQNVLPIFIFDTVILDALEDRHDRRVEFILDSLLVLQQEFSKLGSSLLVMHGNPVDIFKTLSPKAVYTNHDYEPYAVERDRSVKDILQSKGASFHTYKDQVIFEKSEITKDDGNPYTVFTPYSKKWKATLTDFYLSSYPVEKYVASLHPVKPLPLPSLHDLGFLPTGITFPSRVIKTSIISRYKEQRDFPAIAGTSRLSVHLRFGTVSIRKLARVAIEKNETWLNELIWREFYAMILWHFPHVTLGAFKPAYNNIEWRNDHQEFERWCEGKTGYPIVDAGMRELNTTGFMHNRVRMITASFLTKHLLIDWQWGEAYFAKKLLDFDLASNNGGWQWAAGTGCDASPYFRVFNPYIQTKKFDPDYKYIRNWIPELDSVDYPQPIVEHSYARARVLTIYKKAVGA